MDFGGGLHSIYNELYNNPALQYFKYQRLLCYKKPYLTQRRKGLLVIECLPHTRFCLSAFTYIVSFNQDNTHVNCETSVIVLIFTGWKTETHRLVRQLIIAIQTLTQICLNHNQSHNMEMQFISEVLSFFLFGGQRVVFLMTLKAHHIGGPLLRSSTLLALQRAAFRPGTSPYLVPFLPSHGSSQQPVIKTVSRWVLYGSALCPSWQADRRTSPRMFKASQACKFSVSSVFLQLLPPKSRKVGKTSKRARRQETQLPATNTKLLYALENHISLLLTHVF